MNVSCGCSCYDCRHEDLHSCGRTMCGYTKVIRTTKPILPAEPIESVLAMVREKLGMQFKSIKSRAMRERLAEWGKCVIETAGLEEDERRKTRAEKQVEIFGVPL